MGDASSAGSDDEGQSLRRAFEHAKALREENAVLRENFENLKNLYKERANEKEQLESKCASLFEERVAIEAQYQRFCEEWRAEVAEKHRAFEDARSQILQPRELELLRLKLIEELEVPHRNNCKALEHEAEVAQQQFVKARREAEQLRTDLEVAGTRHLKELANLQAEQEAEKQSLRIQIGKLEEALAGKSDSQQHLNTVQKEVAALLAQKKDLIEEVDDVRKEKEAAVVALQRASIEFERQLHAVHIEEQSARRQSDDLARKCRHLESELEAAIAGAESAHGHVMEVDKEQAAASALAEQTIHKLETDLFNTETRLRATQSEFEETLVDLQSSLDEKEQVIASLTAQHSQELEQARAELALKVREEEERQRDRRRQLEGEAADLRAALAAAELALSQGDVSWAEQAEELNKEAVAVRKELGQVEVDLRAAELALAAAHADVARVESEVGEARQEIETLGAENQQLRQRNKELSEEHREMREAREQAESALQRARHELAAAETRAEKECKDFDQQLAEAKGAWALERAVLTQRAAQLTKQEVERYKARAKAAKQHARQCKELLASVAADRQQLLLKLSDAEAQVQAFLALRQEAKVVAASADSEAAVAAHKRSAAWYKAELAQLRQRQATYLKQLEK